jgi:RNA polymerase sigma-70 factor (ECF subfamily)
MTTVGDTMEGAHRVRGRDALASELFAAHYARLAGWVNRLVDDEATAHDIAAEAFVRVLSRLTTADDPRAYLYAAASNLVRDHWRRKERERRAYARARTPDAVVDGPDPGVRALVEALPDRLRVVVLLHYYADLPLREVARVVGRPEGTVKRALYDARALLLTALGGER